MKMRLSLTGIDGRTITFERHLRVGVMPGETAATVKIGPGPIIRLSASQEEQVKQFFAKDAQRVVSQPGGTFHA